MTAPAPGRVVWIIGLSGAGKTAIGTALWHRMRAWDPATVLLDGDAVREVMGNDLGHSLEDRLRNAWRLARLGAFLSRQGISVVCPNISLFPELRVWNRENLPSYFEVYVRVPMEVLKARDSKGLYRRALAGELRDVVGVDLPYPEPEHSDLVLDNSVSLPSLSPLVDRILERLG